MKPKPYLNTEPEQRKVKRETNEATKKLKDQVQDSVQGLASFQDIKPRGQALLFPEPEPVSIFFEPLPAILYMAGSFSLGLAVQAMMVTR